MVFWKRQLSKDSVIDKNTKTISANLEHFSKYVIGDSSKIITNLNDIDVVFAIDTSGSMIYNDPSSERTNVCKNFVTNLDGDNYRYGIVTFNNGASALNKGPIEVDFSQVKNFNINNAHSVVGETLYQDREDPTIYYLGIYDSNHPDHEEYIKIEENYYLTPTFSSRKITTLDPIRSDYDWAELYYSFDVRSLEKYLK